MCWPHVHFSCLHNWRWGGREGTGHRKVSAAPVCFTAQKPELQWPHFLMSKMVQLYAKNLSTFFKSNLTLHLFWQHMYLPWLGFQAHWDCKKIWCILDHALCNVHWEYYPQVLIMWTHVISHIIHYRIFCLHTSNIFFSILPENLAVFLEKI